MMTDGVVLDGARTLFGSPLFEFSLPDAGRLNAELLSIALAARTGSPGVRRSNRGGWQSHDDLFRRDQPACRALCRHLVDAAEAATQAVAPDFDREAGALQVEGWFNINETGHANAPHDHPGWLWVGVYYVQAATGSGEIELVDARPLSRAQRAIGAGCFAASHRVTPRPGLLLLFPSHLRHSVAPNAAATPRVSVAFNARYRELPPPDPR